MSVVNVFKPKPMAEVTNREERASILAGTTLVAILEKKALGILEKNPDAMFKIEGSSVDDLRIWVAGINHEEAALLQAFTGIVPQVMESAIERTA